MSASPDSRHCANRILAGDADIEDKRRQLAALDELRLRRERRLEVWRQAQPDAIDPSGPSAASASESVDTDADSHAKE